VTWQCSFCVIFWCGAVADKFAFLHCDTEMDTGNPRRETWLCAMVGVSACKRVALVCNVEH